MDRKVKVGSWFDKGVILSVKKGGGGGKSLEGDR